MNSNEVGGLLSFLAQLTPSQWAAIVSSVLGAYYTVCSMLAFVLGILGNRYPWAMRAAVWFGDRGRRLQPIGNAVGAALPGGFPPAQAMARSIAPRPSLIEMCGHCGQPMMSNDHQKRR